jgi:hypothetical protein
MNREEEGIQKKEVRRQNSEDRRQKSEVRRQNGFGRDLF